MANGDPVNSIDFLSGQPDPAPGDWSGIYFNGADPGCLLDHCEIRHGGSNAGSVYIHNSSSNVTISNSDIIRSATAGVYIYDYYVSASSPTITGCNINDNATYGIYSGVGYSLPHISDCSLQDNGGWAIRVWAEGVKLITGAISISGNGQDAIYVDGVNTYDGTWLDHGVPHVIGGNFTVMDGNTLTIDPGCTIMPGTSVQITVEGALVADGTPAERITFTSSQATPTPGDWSRLYFSAADSGTVLDNCLIEYGGGNSGNLYLHNGSDITISDCEITDSGAAGVYIYDYYAIASYPTISGCTISGNASYGIYAGTGYSWPSIEGCTFTGNGGWAIRVWANGVKLITGAMSISGNGEDAIYVDGVNTYDGTWLYHDVPHVIGSNFTVMDGNTLTIDPGCTIMPGTSVQITVEGALVADGTPAERITFTSSQATPTPGDWSRLYFSAADSGTVLDNCLIEYGGGNSGNLYLHNGSDITISDCEITDSGAAGVYIYDYYAIASYPTISGCTISGNASYGIYAGTGYSWPSIEGCTFTGNGGWAIRVWANGVKLITGAMSISGNGEDAIYVDGVNTYDGTWLYHGVPHVIGSSFTVIDGNTLTIDPGCTIKPDTGVQITVEGALVADGTPAERITFTSAQASPTPGDWNRLYFNAPDAGTALDNCDIHYGGGLGGNLYLHNNSDFTISNCTVSHSASAGINIDDYYVTTSDAVIDNCLISDNATWGVRCYNAGDQTLSDCVILDNAGGYYANWHTHHFLNNNQIYDNAGDGIHLTGDCGAVFGGDASQWNDVYDNGGYNLQAGTPDIQARYVYWGSVDPVAIEASIQHEPDNGALGLVTYWPWLNQSHEPQDLPAPENLQIVVASDTVTLSWTAVPGATSYRVYSATEAYGAYTEDLSGAFAGPNWSAPLSGDLRFYEVTAVAE